MRRYRPRFYRLRLTVGIILTVTGLAMIGIATGYAAIAFHYWRTGAADYRSAGIVIAMAAAAVMSGFQVLSQGIALVLDP